MDAFNTPTSEDLLAIMQLSDDFRVGLEMSEYIKSIPFDQVTSEVWEKVQLFQEPFQILVKSVLDSMPNAVKVISNEAANAHVNAVIASDD